jgi:hypothetical protein
MVNHVSGAPSAGPARGRVRMLLLEGVLVRSGGEARLPGAAGCGMDQYRERIVGID